MMLLIAALLTLPAAVPQETRKPEATSLLGKPLVSPEPPAERKAAMEKDLADARAEYDKNPASADAAIWVGRRTAYLGRYREAIGVFSDAIAKHPSDARLYRHRGHRYITVREFDKAIDDLSKAAALVRDKPDEVEPDGQPNARNIPTSTLQTNIYYHLALARYLKGEFAAAANAYHRCMALSKNADMQVATAHWQYMTLRRLKRDADAAKVLEAISAEMPVIENTSYHRLLMMYKGATDADALLDASKKESLDAVTIGYGIANWHLYNGRADRAKAILSGIVNEYETRQWAGFGYIASEADLARLR